MRVGGEAALGVDVEAHEHAIAARLDLRHTPDLDTHDAHVVADVQATARGEFGRVLVGRPPRRDGERHHRDDGEKQDRDTPRDQGTQSRHGVPPGGVMPAFSSAAVRAGSMICMGNRFWMYELKNGPDATASPSSVAYGPSRSMARAMLSRLRSRIPRTAFSLPRVGSSCASLSATRFEIWTDSASTFANRVSRAARRRCSSPRMR